MKEIVSYRKGQFTDYVGNVHQFVVAAVSTTELCGPDSDLYLTEYDNNYGDIIDEEPVNKGLLIGIAICNPRDEFDEEKGKKIAHAKAANMETLPRIYTPCKGVITKELVDAFLKQQVQFAKEDPERLIKGYDAAKKVYEETRDAKAAIEQLQGDERAAFDLAVKGIDFAKYVKLAKIYVKRILKNE